MLSPSSPHLISLLCYHFFQSPNPFWNSVFGIDFSLINYELLISSNLSTFQVLINNGTKKSDGTKSDEYEGWGIIFGQKLTSRLGSVSSCIIVMQFPLIVLLQIRRYSSKKHKTRT